MDDKSILEPEPRYVDTIPDNAGSTTIEKPFPFLDLPPEVRNKIYQCPCIYETLSLRARGQVWASFADLRQASITRVNKQIRNETLPIFYGNHDFIIRLPPLPSDWQSMRPRHEAYHDHPFEHFWRRLDAFTPDQKNNLQENSLQFLSSFTLEIKIDPSRQWRLAMVGFFMSSRELDCDEDVVWEEAALVKTAGVDWNNCFQVKEAYLRAVDSCLLVREAHDLFNMPGVCCRQVDQAASALAALMCRVAKLCPHLTNNVTALIDPSHEFAEDMAEKQARETLIVLGQ
ncbi:hypothetical protein KVR01_008923 [Diaporthe batatas]|uniref:uncharacterized protein n=1 Tax=Diaporthe batatas TaxID=748121 RepID=UPI001D05929F|nr:uncharacterized protein KVR01_008923 [Diaporthe batatas]KAG8160659.1 hypothetical protein KVR01_008923 [Diaporthe batatas]